MTKRTWTVGWATSIGGAHVMPVHGGGLAKPNRLYFKSYYTTLKHAGYLINASMEAWTANRGRRVSGYGLSYTAKKVNVI